ncbi:hypothetical protein AB1285_20420 [Microbacterium sp. NRRL B-14842]|uniref:hypothetical protein n=1 Tax=Microbacterium sp. NRRL B-14842 TaxID=3162881 RepID=UPI003D2939CA
MTQITVVPHSASSRSTARIRWTDSASRAVVARPAGDRPACRQPLSQQHPLLLATGELRERTTPESLHGRAFIAASTAWRAR